MDGIHPLDSTTHPITYRELQPGNKHFLTINPSLHPTSPPQPHLHGLLIGPHTQTREYHDIFLFLPSTAFFSSASSLRESAYGQAGEAQGLERRHAFLPQKSHVGKFLIPHCHAPILSRHHLMLPWFRSGGGYCLEPACLLARCQADLAATSQEPTLTASSTSRTPT